MSLFDALYLGMVLLSLLTLFVIVVTCALILLAGAAVILVDALRETPHDDK